MKKILYISAFVCSTLMANEELQSIKEQLKIQQQTTKRLEQKLDMMQEAQNQKSINNSASFSQNEYLPEIALILNMSALSRDVKNSDYEDLSIPGFIDSGDAKLPFNKNRGLNLNYAEVAMHSVVDPYFEAFANFHLHPDAFEIGEAYVQTTSLPYSLRIKAGKFKSNFGRINSKHQHSWRFDDQPIIFKSLFGPDGISDPAIQLQWVAPTDIYLMFGTEAMQGTNERSFGAKDSNNLYTGYLKTSIDITDDLCILGGMSYAHGSNEQNGKINPTDIYGIDFTLTQQFGSYSSLLWQSEFIRRDKKGEDDTSKQSGLYSEVVYQYNNNYSLGARYDRILKNDTDLEYYKNNNISTSNLDKYTAMIEYKPFPMSRLRLSYSYDTTKVINNKRKEINQIMLSLNIAAGAHGAHDY